jgi:hypothetical protein
LLNSSFLSCNAVIVLPSFALCSFLLGYLSISRTEGARKRPPAAEAAVACEDECTEMRSLVERNKDGLVGSGGSLGPPPFQVIYAQGLAPPTHPPRKPRRLAARHPRRVSRLGESVLKVGGRSSGWLVVGKGVT